MGTHQALRARSCRQLLLPNMMFQSNKKEDSRTLNLSPFRDLRLKSERKKYFCGEVFKIGVFYSASRYVFVGFFLPLLLACGVGRTAVLAE
jgi:hypothetical protein